MVIIMLKVTGLNKIIKYKLGKYNSLAVDKEEVNICEIWLKIYLRKRPYSNVRGLIINKPKIGNTYHLKHSVENWAQALNKLGIKLKDDNGNIITNMYYVSEAAFLSALDNLDYIYNYKESIHEVIPFAVYNGSTVVKYNDRAMPHTREEWLRVLAPMFSNIVVDIDNKSKYPEILHMYKGIELYDN